MHQQDAETTGCTPLARTAIINADLQRSSG